MTPPEVAAAHQPVGIRDLDLKLRAREVEPEHLHSRQRFADRHCAGVGQVDRQSGPGSALDARLQPGVLNLEGLPVAQLVVQGVVEGGHRVVQLLEACSVHQSAQQRGHLLPSDLDHLVEGEVMPPDEAG